MANRVVIGPLPGGGSGLRISKPGYNVLSESLAPRNVAFDSNWNSTFKVFMSGTVSVPVATAGSQYTTVSFGTTFSSPPICLAWMFNSQLNPNALKFLDGTMMGFTDWPDETVYAGCRITTTSIQFIRYFPAPGSHGPYTAQYIVLTEA